MGTPQFEKALGACLFDMVTDPVLVVDPKGTLLAVNRAAALYLGDAPERIVGRSVSEMFPADQAQRQLEVIRRVVETGEPFSEERVTSIGESNFVFHYSVQRLDDEDGKPLAVVGVVRDVTAPAALEGRYSELYEKATDALFALDGEGRFRIVNRQAEVMTGYRRDAVESVHFSQLVPPDEVDRLQGHFEARVQGRDAPTQYELRYLHASGEERWAEVRISREASSAGVYQASLRDVTPRKRLEEMRRDFLHMVSHGVKTPLTVLHGYANALAGGKFGRVTPEQEKALRGMLQATERMRTLMEQFLLAERLDLDVGASAQAGLASAAVLEVVTSAQHEAESKGIRLHADLSGCGDAEVGDAEGLACIVENFLSNALKFTPTGGTVAVSGSAEGRDLRIEVRDTGRGIPHRELARIFDRFYRLPSSSDTWGSGLGLYIARRWAERMGGRVEASSCAEDGTCFTAWLPIHRP